jgi:hypothetical protein
MVKKASPLTSRAKISLKNLTFSRADAKAAAAGARSKWDAKRSAAAAVQRPFGSGFSSQ